MASAGDLTRLLQAWSRGEEHAVNELAPLVHHELRELARRLLERERHGQWQPTDLVHEGYLRLLTWRAVRWQNRAHFFSTAAKMMRRVLVDAARARSAARRGGGQASARADIDLETIAETAPAVDIVALDDALAALASLSPRASQVVELRFFGGFSVEETADTLNVSTRTVINDWNTARAWLFQQLNDADGHDA